MKFALDRIEVIDGYGLRFLRGDWIFDGRGTLIPVLSSMAPFKPWVIALTTATKQDCYRNTATRRVFVFL